MSINDDKNIKFKYAQIDYQFILDAANIREMKLQQQILDAENVIKKLIESNYKYDMSHFEALNDAKEYWDKHGK